MGYRAWLGERTGALLIMQQRTLSPVFTTLLATGAFALGGCSLALDTQKAQCSKPSDCAGKIGGSATQLCVAGFCEPVTCMTDDECKERDGAAFKTSYCGPAPGMGTTLVCHPAECSTEKKCDDEGDVCKLDSSQCVALNDATCIADADCANYDGLANNICEDSRCESPECTKDDQCTGGQSCVMGRCDDVTWGCADQGEDRTPTLPTATLRVKVTTLTGGTLKPDEELAVKVCSVAVPDCMLEVADAAWSYDSATGFLEVTGLTQRQKFWLSITAKNQAQVDWYTQRPPIDVTEEPEPIVLVPANIGTLIGNNFDPPIFVDLENKATMIIRVYNCSLKNAEGVSVRMNKPTADEKIFYLDANYSILLDEQETDATGTAGIANTAPIPNRVIVERSGGAGVTEFNLTPRTKVLTYLALYPRNYDE